MYYLIKWTYLYFLIIYNNTPIYLIYLLYSVETREFFIVNKGNFFIYSRIYYQNVNSKLHNIYKHKD